MEHLTLETLPKAFTQLTKEVSEIKRLLLEKSNEQPTETVRWFDLNELCNYHPDKPSKPTVYGWVNAGTIPVHKGGKKLRFLKSEIDNWLKKGRKRTLDEIANEADTFIKIQLKKVFEGFFNEPQSMKMLSVKLNIDRANICWYCREFRKSNQIGIAKRGICLITKQRVNYYTTNPQLFQKSKQTKLF